MLKFFSATDTQKKLLSYTPKITCCLPNRNNHNLENLSGTIIFLWLLNGNGFWFHITAVQKDKITGYAYINSKWFFKSLSKMQILRYY